MAIQVTTATAAQIQVGAPLLARCRFNDAIGVFAGPCKEGGAKILTLRDYVVDCIPNAHDNDAMDYAGIEDVEFDLSYGPTSCFLLTRQARPNAYEAFRWRRKWLGDEPVLIRNDPQQRPLPEGDFRRYLAQTLRQRADNGDRHALTAFLIDGVYDQLACMLVYEIKYARPGRRKLKRRAVFFVDEAATLI
ncbi:MAG: hypothetical protein MRY74_13525 [Neomegalonema sp.]|nr:hypothetical protein [Neomegalonema sp.]